MTDYTVWLLTNVLTYLWLIDGITDSVVWGLTSLWNDLWLIDSRIDSTVVEEWRSYWHGFNYSCLIYWLTGFTVRKLTNILNAYCVIHWPTEILYDRLYCLRVFKLTEWFMAYWLTVGLPSLIYSLKYCMPDYTANQLTEWFMADWWTNWLTLLSKDFLTYCSIVYRWLIDFLTLLSEVLTNWLNNLWLTDWLTDWLFFPRTG